jgi:hypothetical protein
MSAQKKPVVGSWFKKMSWISLPGSYSQSQARAVEDHRVVDPSRHENSSVITESDREVLAN